MGLLAGEFAHQLEDGAVEDDAARFDGFGSDGLREVAFAHSGRADQQDVAVLADEVAGGQFVDLGAVDGRVEAEVEVVQAARFAEPGGFVAPGDLPLAAHVDFVLEDEFEELGVGKPVAFGLPQPQVEAVKQPREPQRLGVLFEVGVGHGDRGGVDVVFGFVDMTRCVLG